MPTIKDYFLTDTKQSVTMSMSQELTDKESGIVIPVRMFPDYTNGSMHFSFYLPEVENPLEQCLRIVSSPDSINSLVKASRAVTILGGFPEQTMPIPSASLNFGGHIYFYSENDLKIGRASCRERV